jgi:hypothetical protein
MGRRRLLRELDSEEISEQMAFDLLDVEESQAARSRRPAPAAAPPRAPSPVLPARAPTHRAEVESVITSVFLKFPGAKLVGP